MFVPVVDRPSLSSRLRARLLIFGSSAQIRTHVWVGKSNDFDRTLNLHFYECIYGQALAATSKVSKVTVSKGLVGLVNIISCASDDSANKSQWRQTELAPGLVCERDPSRTEPTSCALNPNEALRLLPLAAAARHRSLELAAA